MSIRNWFVALACASLVTLPLVALATILDWPAITFLGAVLLGGSVGFAFLERTELRRY